ncbi:MAG: hypothetical protein ACYDCK_04170 [Thermoplasmatota archaeon]
MGTMGRPTFAVLALVIGFSAALAGCAKNNPSPATSTPTGTTSATSPTGSTSTTNPTNPTGTGGTGTHAPVVVAFDINYGQGPGCPQGTTDPACTPATKSFDVSPAGWKTLHFVGNITGSYPLGAHMTISDSAKAKAYDKELPGSPSPSPNPNDPTSVLTPKAPFAFDLTSNAAGTFAALLYDEDPVSGGVEVKGTITASY